MSTTPKSKRNGRKPRSTFVKKTSLKRGLPPGSIIHIGEHQVPTEVSSIRFTSTTFEETQPQDPLQKPNEGEIVWHNICGISDIEFIQKLGASFSLHPMVLEDIANTSQRPKLDELEHYTFLVLKMASLDADGHYQDEQVTFLLGNRFLLSFQERKGDVFDSVRKRLKDDTKRFYERGASYLFYTLVDAVVDHYFVILERIGDQLQNMEDRVLLGTDESTTSELYLLRRHLVLLRKSAWPLREILGAILRDRFRFIQQETLPYFRDVYDHTIQVIDTIEAMREVAGSIREMMMAELSRKMNAIMKVLTIIATIFIPLTFLAGVYGMNFQHMPELTWRYGYLGVWLVFVLLAGGMIWYFRRKNWL